MALSDTKGTRRADILAESGRVGELYRTQPEVREFYDSWADPDPKVFGVVCNLETQGEGVGAGVAGAREGAAFAVDGDCVRVSHRV